MLQHRAHHLHTHLEVIQLAKRLPWKLEAWWVLGLLGLICEHRHAIASMAPIGSRTLKQRSTLAALLAYPKQRMTSARVIQGQYISGHHKDYLQRMESSENIGPIHQRSPSACAPLSL